MLGILHEVANYALRVVLVTCRYNKSFRPSGNDVVFINNVAFSRIEGLHLILAALPHINQPKDSRDVPEVHNILKYLLVTIRRIIPRSYPLGYSINKGIQ